MKQFNTIAFTCLCIAMSMCTLQAQNGANILLDKGPCDPIVILFCPSGVVDAGKAADNDLTTYATMKTTLGLLSSSYLQLGFTNPAPGGSMVAVYVGDDVALNIDVLASVRLQLLNSSGAVIADKDGLALADIKLASDGRGIVKIKVPKNSTAASLRLTLGGLLSLNNQMEVYGAVHAPAAVSVTANAVYASGPCDPIVPLTCSAGVINPAAAADANKHNHATLSIPLGITASAYLDLSFPSSAPGGSTVAFSCATNGDLLDVAVLNNLKLTLFDAAGNIVASKNGYSLAEVDLIGSDKFTVKIRVPGGASPVRARLTLKNVVGLLSEVLVYSAYYTPEINFEDYFRSAEQIASADLIIYPNPASDIIYLHTEGINTGAIASVYSIDGQMLSVYSLTADETNEIPVQGLQNGMYILSVSGSNYQNSSTFMIQR